MMGFKKVLETAFREIRKKKYILENNLKNSKKKKYFHLNFPFTNTQLTQTLKDSKLNFLFNNLTHYTKYHKIS